MRIFLLIAAAFFSFALTACSPNPTVSGKPLSAWISALKDQDHETVDNALKQIDKIEKEQCKRARKPLRELACDSKRWDSLRVRAAGILQWKFDESTPLAIDALFSILKDGDESFGDDVDSAANLLAKMPAQSDVIVPKAVAMFPSAGQPVQRALIWILKSIGGKAIPALDALAKTPDLDSIVRTALQDALETTNEDKDIRSYFLRMEAMQYTQKMRELDERIKANEDTRQKEDQAEKDRQAKASEVEQRQRQAEQKRMAAEAEIERIRRFAPVGTVYNLKLLSVSYQDGLASIPAGTELKVTKKNPDGTLHVENGDLATDVSPTAVTNDRDLAASLRSEDKNKQDALRQ